MMMSMYSAVSGLRSQQTKLNVIGNNIANINTVGYKSQSVSFGDLLSQTISSSSAPTATSGGTNPMQIGLGTSVSSININMDTGSTQYTGSNTDLAIGGSGFFIVEGGGVGEYQFTRAGNFGVDVSGNLTVNGMRVCGWQQYSEEDGEATFDTQKGVEPINLFSDSYNSNKKVIPPVATTEATLAGNLDPSATAKGTALDAIGTSPATPDATTTLTVYDALGNAYDVQVKLSKCYVDSTTDAANPVTSWYWEADTSSTTAGVSVSGSGYLQFDASGKIVNTAGCSTTPDLTMTPISSTTPFDVTLDFSGVSTYTTSTSGSSVAVSNIDGYASGELQDFSIGTDGVITGIYSNSQKQPLGMIALANFTNPAGLEKIGENLYTTTVNSGNFTGGVAVGTGGTGSLSSGTLEMSNVDLAEQFSEMMVTQRAYQANSKIITTSDQMLQDVINMVR